MQILNHYPTIPCSISAILRASRMGMASLMISSFLLLYSLRTASSGMVYRRAASLMVIPLSKTGCMNLPLAGVMQRHVIVGDGSFHHIRP